MRDHTEFLMSANELFGMIQLQEELNHLYSGENWTEVVKAGHIESAMLKEYSELLDEIQDQWCWYKKSNTFDRDKAIFELIDVLHFALMLPLYSFDIKEVQAAAGHRKTHPDVEIVTDDPFKTMSFVISNIITAFEFGNVLNMVREIRNLVEIGGHMLNMDKGDVYKAYCLKNQRNRERVLGGILKGEYRKEDEVALTLGTV